MADKNGKQHGGYTRVLNSILDDMPSGTQMKITIFILRCTIGWKKKSDRISISQIMHGAGVSDKTATNVTNYLSNLGISKIDAPGVTTRFTVSDTLFSASEPYTRFPNQIIDDLLPTLTGAEFKILAYIVRETIGRQRKTATITKMNFRTATNLSRNRVPIAIAKLTSKNIITQNGSQYTLKPAYSLPIKKTKHSDTVKQYSQLTGIPLPKLDAGLVEILDIYQPQNGDLQHAIDSVKADYPDTWQNELRFKRAVELALGY
ncbi:MAG TPA: replication protein [Chloroflexi bacterium]|nr:replication protein [Chloroflexota bacterium]